MYNRRSFIKSVGIGVILASTESLALARKSDSGKRLIILHTNDVHSHLEPFSDNHPLYPGMGGVAARKALIDAIRKEGQEVLLLDAGDIFQGTPYFNFFKGEPEIAMMNKMGYDVATIGNHDFDGGITNLSQQIKLAGFTFVCCNYDFHNTALKDQIVPYKIFKKGNLKIGVVGVGIELKGLVPDNLCEGIVYRDPVQSVNETAAILKKEQHCDLVIALSHLGYKYPDNKVSDVVMARNSMDLDIIIGGHTHTFMDKPDMQMNLNGKEVLIHQAGWAGVRLGRINVDFEKKLNKNHLSTNTVIVDKKSIAI